MGGLMGSKKNLPDPDVIPRGPSQAVVLTTDCCSGHERSPSEALATGKGPRPTCWSVVLVTTLHKARGQPTLVFKAYARNANALNTNTNPPVPDHEVSKAEFWNAI
ncbi:hypothetical protein MTR67_052152 [Solanum verrucosum]|uniref:Uncharacterized protein n=1 Tax=Solanum verrucosum TaxID=315347 RepID=A0AAF0V6D9_SOLVR|nr:hypothetical protein MTR67_052152 [Solanum verrucosum]